VNLVQIFVGHVTSLASSGVGDKQRPVHGYLFFPLYSWPLSRHRALELLVGSFFFLMIYY